MRYNWMRYNWMRYTMRYTMRYNWMRYNWMRYMRRYITTPITYIQIYIAREKQPRILEISIGDAL